MQHPEPDESNQWNQGIDLIGLWMTGDRPTDALASIRQPNHQRQRHQRPADQPPNVAAAHQFADPPAHFPCRQRGEEPDARGVPPMDEWNLVLVAAQQPQMGNEGQRPDDISKVFKRVHCPCRVSQRQCVHERQERDHGVTGVIPAQAAPQNAKQRAGRGDKQKNDMNAVETQLEGTDSDIGRDLFESAAEPPKHSPTKQRRGDVRYFLAQALALLFEIPGGKKAAYADHDATEIEAIEYRHRAERFLCAEKKRHAGGKLQKNAEAARQNFILAHADPNNRGAFQCPGRRGPATVEGERNRQRSKHDA